MKLLITPAQVAEMAFLAPDFINTDAVSVATIFAAQQKFIRPVLGSLYDSLCCGEYTDFLLKYIMPPLAIYVKILMMPSLAVQAGTFGVVEVSSKNLVRAGDVKLRYAIRALRNDAFALMERAVAHIESNAADFPEYNKHDNVRNRLSIDGGMVLR